MDLKKNIYVSNLFYYPLKSGMEIEEKEVQLNETGIENDRVFVILEKKTHKFINIKQNSKIYYIKIIINKFSVKITIPNNEKIFEIDLETETKISDNSRRILVSIWIFNAMVWS